MELNTLYADKLAYETAAALYSNSAVYPRGSYTTWSKVRAKLSTFSDATLHRIQTVTNPLYSDAILYNLITDTGTTEETFNDYCMLIPTFTTMGTNQKYSNHYARSLDQYLLEPIESGVYPERRVQQASAIVRVTHYLRSQGEVASSTDVHGWEMSFIPKRGLRRLLTDHENPEHVADIVLQRGITDGKSITAILEAEIVAPTPLKTGVL